jgi:hypothetical protein
MPQAEYFRIDATDFGVGQVRLVFHETGPVVSLEITGSQLAAAAIAANERHPFNWLLYPPKMYVQEVPYREEAGLKIVEIGEVALDEYDIGLYLLEHNDVFGTLTIASDNSIWFKGTTFVSGVEVPLEIFAAARY